MGDEPDPKSEPEQKPEPKPEAKSFSQSDLDRVGATEKNAGKRAAMAEVAEKLGMTLDEATEFVKKAREKEAETLSEVERKERAAEERDRKATEREQVAAERELSAEVRVQLIEAGVPKDQATRVRRLLDLEANADEATIAAAIKTLSDEMPNLFDSGGEKEPPRPKDSAPRGTPPKTKPEDARSKARALLLERHPELATKS